MSLPADEAEQAEAAYGDSDRRELVVDESGLKLYLDGALWLSMSRAELLSTPQPDPPLHTGN
jgi:hypothetical protein